MQVRLNHVVACVFGVAAIAALLAGCDDRGKTQSGAPTAPPQAAAADALPAGLVLAEAPPEAKDVVALKKEAKPGDEVVVRGRVGGSESPFVDGRATFQLVDASLKACGEASPDECKTPWDFCCSDPKEISAHSASVQVVGADGKPLRAGLEGVGGLKPLRTVTVKGTVAKAGEGGPLLINARGIYVKGS